MITLQNLDASGENHGTIRTKTNSNFQALITDTNKATILDADIVRGVDSITPFGLVSYTWTNIKSFLKTYFDIFYATIAGSISQAFSVSTIDIGNVDTTISRVSAGRIAVEGVNIPTISSVDTMTNKTLTTPAIASIKGTLTADTDGATITFDKNVSDFHGVTLGGNRTLALSNMAPGDRIVLRLQQDATGSRIPVFFGTIKWVGGTVVVLTTTPNKADALGFFCTSAGNFDGYIIGQNI